MRTVGAVTAARSDFGIYRPILRRIQSDPDLDLSLIVTGTHLSARFGMTVQAIEEEGFFVHERVDILEPSDAPDGISRSIGRGVIGFAEVYGRSRPDILLIVGDRYEMLAAVVASLPFKIPVAHVHGGESTEGAIDEAIRHSITKMAHLHFASTDEYARRIVQMGEEPWRVTTSGAPGLDNLYELQLMTLEEIEEEYSIRIESPPLLVTYHPVTLEYERTDDQMAELLSALDDTGLPIVFTYPNADTGNSVIAGMIEAFVARSPTASLVVSLGTRGYFSLMSHALAMVGNSSSGIIEAASFRLPVVNVGSRQAGRLRGANVIDVGCERGAILDGVRRATSPEFKESLADTVNLYGDGGAAERIVDRLRSESFDDRLLVKRFHDLERIPAASLP
jgi:UDP-hydrolysing UDP-N-acetyl-D-glucosamine 2-epimerase